MRKVSRIATVHWAAVKFPVPRSDEVRGYITHEVRLASRCSSADKGDRLLEFPACGTPTLLDLYHSSSFDSPDQSERVV